MTIAQALLAEFEVQAPITRRFLERVPEDKYTWKPHTKSMSAGQLAYHLAFVPAAVVRAVQTETAEAPGFNNYPEPVDRAELLRLFDASVATVRDVLPAYDDAMMAQIWKLTDRGSVVLEEPRKQFLRDVMLSHWYQHRGQLAVYLRILDIAVPASFGPSADEPPAFAMKSQAA